MAKMSKSVEARFTRVLKNYQKIIQSASIRDINETDTVTIVRDMFTELFGYDKYQDITSELLIRGTYCDLAIIVDGKKHFIVEVKAIGLPLKESHIRQAVNYATNDGVEWVVLTNGLMWQVYKITFQKPIEFDLVFTLDFLNIDPKDERSLDMLYLISKEGITKSAIEEFQLQNKAMNRFTITALIISDPVIASIRRELKKKNKKIKIDTHRLLETIQNDIIKRDIIEDERFSVETKRIRRTATKPDKPDGICIGKDDEKQNEIPVVTSE